MKRRLQILAVCAAALLTVRMMAQDNGGGASSSGGGGDASGGSNTSSGSGDNGNSGSSGENGGSNTSNGSGNSGNSGGNGNSNGSNNSGNSNGGGGMGAPGENGSGSSNSTTNGGEIIPGVEGTQGGGETSPVAPVNPATPVIPFTSVPGAISPIPGTTPAPPFFGGTVVGGGTQGAVQTAPVTFNLPTANGGGAPQSFTLGQGRLSKPPITFTATVTQGYDSNIFSADAHRVATPTPAPGPTPPLEERLVGFRITPPFPPTPIFQTFRASAQPTPLPAATPVGIIGSPVTTLSLGTQVQKGSPRTLVTLDLSAGVQDYWNQPGQKTDYTGNLNTTIVHRFTPRATFSIQAFAVYQKTPDFALINAPTNGGNGGNYLNGSLNASLSYSWTNRISTVSSYSLGLNLLETDQANNLYLSTFGTQLRYTVSARNTVTAEIRDSTTEYPSASAENNTSIFYLLGLDTFLSAKIRNTVSGGIEVESYSSGQNGQTLPYLETATSLGLARGGSLVWTNRIGSEQAGGPNQNASSYRTSLSLTEALSTKLVGSINFAYNYFTDTDNLNSQGSYTQNQLQGSFSLAYNLSPRLSLTLTYTLIEFLTSQVNQSYNRQQIFLGGNYLFR